MASLRAQRLPRVQWHRASLGLAEDRDLAFPKNHMRIERELVFFFDIVKDGHLTLSNHNELLLFVRVEPGNKDMSFDSAREREKAHRHIGNAVMEVVAPLSLHDVRHLSDQSQNHGDVMWRKGPKDVFFSADSSEVEAIRINVTDAAQLAFINQLF